MSGTTQVYRLKAIDTMGVPQVYRIEARSAEEAKKVSGISPTRILSVQPDLFISIMAQLDDSAPSLEIQAQILAIFSAQVASGQSIPATFDRIISGYRKFKKKMPEIRRLPKVSEKLKALKFDKSLQLLADVGENAGTIGEVMSGAADDLIERQKLVGGIIRQAVPSLGSALVGILTMMIVPIFVVDPIRQVEHGRGINFKSNVLTDFLMWDGTLMPHYWWVPLAAIALLVFTKPYWWKYLKLAPGFDTIDSFFGIINSYLFITSFVPLFSRGVPLTKSIEILASYSSGAARRSYDQMVRHLQTGGGMSSAFEDEYWHPLLRDCMRGFNEMRDTEKVALLNRIKPLMTSQLARIGGQMNGVIGIIGLTLSLGVVLIVFIGLMLPLMTLSAQTH